MEGEFNPHGVAFLRTEIPLFPVNPLLLIIKFIIALNQLHTEKESSYIRIRSLIKSHRKK
jgi:hypothetical protein